GVNNLNRLLQEELNPPYDAEGAEKRTIKIGDTLFRVGDRVMIVKNDYERSVYNGDMAKLAAIYEDGKDTTLSLRVFGPSLETVVEIPFNKANEMLRL